MQRALRGACQLTARNLPDMRRHPHPHNSFAVGADVVVDAAPQILAGIAVAIVGVMQVHWYTNMHKREVFMTAICLSLVPSPIPPLDSIGPNPTFPAANDVQRIIIVLLILQIFSSSSQFF
jgi:hypothetical protein